MSRLGSNGVLNEFQQCSNGVLNESQILINTKNIFYESFYLHTKKKKIFSALMFSP
jgi:hypothetical protein